MHLYALVLLLAPPVAIELFRHTEPERLLARLIATPVRAQPKTEPALPTPVHHEKHLAAATAHAALPLNGTMAPVIPAIAPDGVVLTQTSTLAAAVEVPPTALAYATFTRVPYPAEALRRREHGTVILRVLVGADGSAQTIEIQTSSGSPRLDRAARDAVLHWIFRPGTFDGAPRSAWARVPITFDLSTP